MLPGLVSLLTEGNAEGQEAAARVLTALATTPELKVSQAHWGPASNAGALGYASCPAYTVRMVLTLISACHLASQLRISIIAVAKGTSCIAAFNAVLLGLKAAQCTSTGGH